MNSHSPGEFPECGCHYTIDDDGIHFCNKHKPENVAKLAEALDKAYKDLAVHVQSFKHSALRFEIEDALSKYHGEDG